MDLDTLRAYLRTLYPSAVAAHVIATIMEYTPDVTPSDVRLGVLARLGATAARAGVDLRPDQHRDALALGAICTWLGSRTISVEIVDLSRGYLIIADPDHSNQYRLVLFTEHLEAPRQPRKLDVYSIYVDGPQGMQLARCALDRHEDRLYVERVIERRDMTAMLRTLGCTWGVV